MSASQLSEATPATYLDKSWDSRHSVIANKFSSPIPKKANFDSIFNTYSQKPKRNSKVLVLSSTSKSDSKFTRNLSNRYQTVSKLLQNDREK